MTKEEYEQLLKSDYWKGYSFSLIKERDFTCADCGRRFYNERNKLQVHHLVYRDANPWSYRPEELVVLCEDCHKKRHGIKDAPKSTTHDSFPSSSTGKYEKRRWHTNNNRKRYHYYTRSRYSFKGCSVLSVILILFVFAIFSRVPQEQPSDNAKSINTVEKESNTKKTRSKSYRTTAPHSTEDPSSTPIEDPYTAQPSEGYEMDLHDNTTEPIESENTVSTLELLEKKNHDDVVEQAKRAGVSTDGTTIEILERINHADVVKQAKKAGVSTDGTTIEILERINHADVVKQAKRAGVSTDGTTIEILERIHHKNLEKYNQ